MKTERRFITKQELVDILAISDMDYLPMTRLEVDRRGSILLDGVELFGSDELNQNYMRLFRPI